MIIETKFNIGDDAWFIDNNRVRKATVKSIRINDTQIDYRVEHRLGDELDDVFVQEKAAFRDQLELSQYILTYKIK